MTPSAMTTAAGPATRSGDLGGQALGQRLSRTDEAGSGRELDEPALRDALMEAVQEPRVPRPDQPLVTMTLVGEKAHGPPRR